MAYSWYIPAEETTPAPPKETPVEKKPCVKPVDSQADEDIARLWHQQQKPYQYYAFRPEKARFGYAVQISEIAFFENGKGVAPYTAWVWPPHDSEYCKANPNWCKESDKREGPMKAIDRNVDTQWVDQNKRVLIVKFQKPQLITGYTFTTAKDFVERDPIKWKLLAWNEGDKETVTVHEVKEDYATTMARRMATSTFSVVEGVGSG